MQVKLKKYNLIQVSHEDIHVEVYVHDKLILGADGFEDYREKFNNVLQYFKNDRKIDGFHTVTLANYTLNIDGSVIINLNYKMHERPKSDPNAEKIWKSSGYYINHWVPLQKGSLKLQDWKIKNYYVYVVNTSDNFGAEENAACDDLCQKYTTLVGLYLNHLF